MASRDLIRGESKAKEWNKTGVAKAVLTAAAADPRTAITHKDWNTDPWLLGVPGGILDLKTAELLPADPEKRINSQTLVAPAEPGTVGVVWKKFLDEATKGDIELLRLLQQMAGYLLTGDTSEEIFFFIHGPGGNGKGVFMGAIGAIMRDYAKSASMRLLWRQRTTATSPSWPGWSTPGS
jgi:putative DNA primase/helicase